MPLYQRQTQIGVELAMEKLASQIHYVRPSLQITISSSTTQVLKQEVRAADRDSSLDAMSF
jgi:hypothetical protein